MNQAHHRISYVNGAYVPHSQAFVHIEDRGYQFADGVYEVANLINGTMLDGEAHMARLKRSLELLNIAPPMGDSSLNAVLRELVRRNRAMNGILYYQVTRGVQARNHIYPSTQGRSSITATISPLKTPTMQAYETGSKAITYPDIRWSFCHAKTIGLLGNIMAKQAAHVAGAREAIFIMPEGTVTEGGSTNVFIVEKGTIKTHPLNERVLPGITRDGILKLARKQDMPVQEMAFSENTLRAAEEVFISSTTLGVMPITRIDGKPMADGKPGPLTRRLFDLYQDYVRQATGLPFVR